MQIHQLQVVFDPAEDRLRIRLSTTAGDEFRLFLTRRFVRLLWPEINKVLAASALARVPAAVVPGEVVAFEREKALSSTDFKTPYQELQAEVTRRFPLGEAPFLATRGRVQQDRPGHYRLTLDPQEGPGIELALDDRLMHSFIRLLESAVRGADWNLDIGPSGLPSQESPTAADASPARTLN